MWKAAHYYDKFPMHIPKIQIVLYYLFSQLLYFVYCLLLFDYRQVSLLSIWGKILVSFREKKEFSNFNFLLSCDLFIFFQKRTF